MADGQQVYADADGKLLLVHRKQIEVRGPLSISLMPPALQAVWGQAHHLTAKREGEA